MPRLQALVVRDKKLLLVKHRLTHDEWWCLPGGAQEPNELPEQGVLRELKEECNVDGIIVKLVAFVSYPPEREGYTFLVDIGNQNPSLGYDPEASEGTQPLILVDAQWLHLSEISEKDRAYLWSVGLLNVEYFAKEVARWGSEISYPNPLRVGNDD
jgi:8-oxo-dGTP diphosphatase